MHGPLDVYVNNPQVRFDQVPIFVEVLAEEEIRFLWHAGIGTDAVHGPEFLESRAEQPALGLPAVDVGSDKMAWTELESVSTDS